MKRCMGRRIFLGLLGIGFLGLLYACGEIGGSGQCEGVEGSGVCLKIESILPTYEVGGGATSNVDAFIDICDIDEETGEITVEEITDHNATVTFRNDPMPGAAPSTARDVTITRYTLTYTLNNCPTGATCPTLNTQTVTPGETLFIPANGTVSRDLKFVDLAKKMEYATAIGDDMFGVPFGSLAHTVASLEYPSYTVTYTFEGTDIFSNSVSVVGYSEFTIGDYNNCE